MQRRLPTVVAGIAAAALALGTAEVVAAAFTGPRTAPLVAVGSAVIDGAPEPAKHLAISVFGTNDKLALLIGTALLFAAVVAVIATLAARPRGGRLALVVGSAALAGVGVAAAVTRAGAGWTAALPSVVGALVGAAALRWLLSLAADSPPASAPDGLAALERRRFLLGTAAVGAAAAVGWSGARLAGRLGGAADERAAVRLPLPSAPAAALPSDAATTTAGLSSFVTATRDFYRIDTALAVPRISPDTWRLRIHGRVGRPRTLGWDELVSRPVIERYLTLTCVSNEVGGELAGNARWLGVPVADLLAEVDPDPAADQLVSRSIDGFTAGTPTAVLGDGRDAILAIGMNGEPLPFEHGFPVRLIVPGLYGYVGATKWLTELELTTFDAFDAYWVRKGWSARAPGKISARIDTPRSGRSLRAGPVVVAGVAWALHSGVSRVEVRVDRGPWQPASLQAVPSADTWRQWRWAWRATPGRHEIAVRAADATGRWQVESPHEPFPDGATGLHVVKVTVA